MARLLAGLKLFAPGNKLLVVEDQFLYSIYGLGIQDEVSTTGVDVD